MHRTIRRPFTVLRALTAAAPAVPLRPPMRKIVKFAASAWLVIGFLVPRSALGQNRPTAVAATTTTPSDLRAWDQQVDQMIRSRDLRVRELKIDTVVPGRRHERLDQFVRGVRIVGGDLT